ncbi:MAG: type 2 isopentenyl-diphosphate Delta-isomerase [Candidatus Bathyarchaeia archaeon]
MPLRSRTEIRKIDHLDIALREDVGFRSSNWLDEAHLIHRALPELDLDDVRLDSEFLGHRIRAPIMIESMTGGTGKASRLNEILARTAEKFGIPLGLGSQRAALESPRLARTFKVAREAAPSIPIFANIGIPQLRGKDGLEIASSVVEMVDADALCIHLNALQEAVQPEGEPTFSRGLEAIASIAKSLEVPVIAKETGCGISGDVAKSLEGAGVACIDIGGAGGTSWSAVECHRAKRMGMRDRERIGLTFWDWGIPTGASLLEVSNSTGLPLISSGGLRDGLDVAKSIALGASLGGFARKLLLAAKAGPRRLEDAVGILLEELRIAMFLTGCKDVGELRRAPVILSGRLLEWAKLRGIDPGKYSMRR